MKQHKAFSLILLLMLITAELAAQEKTLHSLVWKVAGRLPAASGQPAPLGLAGPLAGVHHKVLLIAGGANFPDGMPWNGGRKKYYDEGFVFQKKEAGTLALLKPFSLPFPLGYSANCSTPQGLVAAGGENEAGLQNTVLLLQWEEVAQNVVTKTLPALPFAVANASLAFHRNKLYLAGGERASDVSDELWMLDFADTAAGWKRLPALPKPLSHAVMVVQGNGKEECLYLIGGRKRNPGGLSDLSASVFQFNLKKGEWSEKAPLPYALSAGTGAAAGGHNVLLFGGDTGETFHKTEALIAAITKETDAAKKQQLNEEKSTVQSNHPGFCRQVLLYDTKKNKWSLDGCLPFAAPVTTTAVNWDDAVYIPGGEIRAGIRTPEILVAERRGF